MQVNNTPIRTRTSSNLIVNKENKMLNQPSQPGSGRSPLTKTLLRKKGNQFKSCANHSDKQAEFKITIDSQTFDYCNKCAAHLASQGFQVDRILNKNNNQQPQHPRKVQLTHFLNSLRNLQGTYRQKLQVLNHINSSYETEKVNANNFYSAMLQYLQYMRQQHIKTLEKESIKHTQICQIQCGQITQTLEEIQNMREDVQSNLQSIVGEVQEDKYRECMSFYLQKVGIYEHRLQELGLQARQAPHFTDEDMQARLQDFKAYVDQITGINILQAGHQQDQI